MRVVMLGTRGFPNVQGGVEKHCEGLSVSLVKLGCEVIVFTRAPYVDKHIKEFQGVKLVTLPALKHKYFENLSHTFIGIFVSLRYKPDILHLQAVGSALLTPLARLLGIKVILTSHGSNYKHLKWGTFAKLFLRLSEFLGITFANEVIAISRTVADEIKGKYNRDADVIPNGVFIPQTTTGERTLEKYSLEKNKYILAVGRFVPEKGFHILIDVFNRADLDGFKLVIAGEADHKDAYSMELKESGLKNKNIIMPGFLAGEPLQELYSHAALFVLPSFYEGLPIVLLEALSYGLSCIASDIPGNRDVKLAKERFFNPGDGLTLSKKLKEFATRPLTENEKEEQMRRTVEEYDWETIAQKTLEVYDRIINRCS